MRSRAKGLTQNPCGATFVSVVVPVYNDPDGLAETLQALAQQDYAPDCWEVIVIDNNSTDHTAEVAQSFSDRLPVLKVLTEASRHSSYAARNTGIKKAAGDVLAFIDADMTVESHWISQGVRVIETGLGDYVGCRVDIHTRSHTPSVWEIHDQRTGFPIGRYMEEQGYTVGGSLFVRRKVLDQVGMFDARLVSSGDLEFGNRVKASGFKLFYDSDNVMRHPARSTFSSAWSKQFRIGKGRVDLRRYYPERYRPLRPWSLLPVFRPAIGLAGILDTSALTFRQRCALLCVENILRLAVASGRMVGCAEIIMRRRAS